MNYYCKSTSEVLEILKVNAKNGLTDGQVSANQSKYGLNKLSRAKKKSLIQRIGESLKEPMLIILLFSFFIAFGTSLGKFFKTGEGEFTECFGILLAVILSVSITLIMEGSSMKAFEALNKIYDNLTVKVVRNGESLIINRTELTVGDIVSLESGDKITADGRIIESNSLSMDESALTGESRTSNKEANKVLNEGTPLAERVNFAYSGTYVSSGEGKMVVTSIGDKTEIGNIAKELVDKKSDTTPLGQKLTKLSKTISVIGIVCAVIVFIASIIKLSLIGGLNFDSIRELFISCIILIVAAVPEGLPTIVAVSLALNMIKMAKENALIKKMSATETAGAVSVICSDKTGTLTLNDMEVSVFCSSGVCSKTAQNKYFIQNVLLNSTAEKRKIKGEERYFGNGTECALLRFLDRSKIDKENESKGYKTESRIPFSSERKTMSTTVSKDGEFTEYIKGAPEKILVKCELNAERLKSINSEISLYQKSAGRIICFGHRSYGGIIPEKFIFDGFVVIVDPIRPEVKQAVKDCKRAGIKIKILTGDNSITAFSVAKELGISTSLSEVVNSSDIENLSDEDFYKAIERISVIARSTPLIKLRVVKALKSHGEVVAVTGDGINDAPAIKKADVGIAMGISGSEITKESADVVLLNDSFQTVVKAISFGRNVYRNIQRFILFQLSVNVSALIFITVCSVMGFNSPFNTFQLLFINVIMDGPPALTLGLEPPSDRLMSLKPVRRKDSIVNAKTLIRILFNGVFIAGILLVQFLTNFLRVGSNEKSGTVFTLFILFQLFNAFNCRELGSESILKRLGKNRIMLYTFLGVFLVHLLIVQVFSSLFSVNPLSFITWIKCIAVSFSIIAVTELWKLLYRGIEKKGKLLKLNVVKKTANKNSIGA